ncbi:MAG: MFS transporter [Trebonia sp.]
MSGLPATHAGRGTRKHARPRAGLHRRPPERRISYSEVLAVREFRWVAVTQALSFLGDQFAQVAIAILVYGRTGSPFLTALAYALTYLPPVVGGPLLSSLADLFPRRRVMITCDLVRIVTVGLMALSGLGPLRAVPLWAVAAFLFGTVLLGAPFSSARAALMPDILPSRQLGIGAAIGNMIHQATQIIGFVAGAAVVATLGEHWTLGIDAGTFGISALVTFAAVKRRPAPARTADGRPSVWTVSADGVRLVFGRPELRTLLLFGWLAGFYVIPEGLAAPYAHSLRGDAVTVGVLMAAVPFGTVIGGVLVGRFIRPREQLRYMGWLAMLSCAPLVVSAWNPPLWTVVTAWLVAGVGGAFQVIAIPAFARSLAQETRARAFGVAQSGLYAVQGLGILAGGAMAVAVGAPMTVGAAGLAGLGAAFFLSTRWTRVRGPLIRNGGG